MKKMQFVFFLLKIFLEKFQDLAECNKKYIYFLNDLNYFKNYFGKNHIFYTEFVFYSVNIQPDIMQNGQKNI